jgi:hypothetical protein
MNFNNDRTLMMAGGLLMLLFTGLFLLGMLSGCAEDAKPLDPHWDRNCQKHYSERQKVLDECKKRVEDTPQAR